MLHSFHKHKKKESSLLDYIVYFFVFTTPVFEIPQALDIYLHQDAANVSLLTWGYFFITDIVWLAYGIHHRLRPIIFSYSLYLLIEGLIVVGILLY